MACIEEGFSSTGWATPQRSSVSSTEENVRGMSVRLFEVPADDAPADDAPASPRRGAAAGNAGLVPSHTQTQARARAQAQAQVQQLPRPSVGGQQAAPGAAGHGRAAGGRDAGIRAGGATLATASRHIVQLPHDGAL